MPRKVFTAGEVLAAADVNLYLSNEVVFASATASTAVASTDRYETLLVDSAGTVTITFGTATAFQAGERMDIFREGAGDVRITSDGTAVSLAGRGTAGTAYAIGQRYDAVSVLCVGTNSYRVIGNAEAV
jgi:5-deoxy-D-glucuronate isomerase